MTASRPIRLASWSSGTKRLPGKHSTLRIHSWLPHGALNGSNGWTHNLEAREFADERDCPVHLDFSGTATILYPIVSAPGYRRCDYPSLRFIISRSNDRSPYFTLPN